MNPQEFAALQAQVAGLSSQLQQQVELSTGINGLFETVTVAPAGIPKSPYDQIKIAVISGTSYLYVYDVTNHAWKRATIA